MNKKITGFTLKMIAVITMFIDHFGATIWERMITENALLGATMDPQAMMIIYLVLRCIGRMAFPIYCFLLVEGFSHTKNCKKYLSRLFLFALISEIPFDMAFNRSILEFGYNNVFFNLFIGLLLIWGVDTFREKYKETMSQVFIWIITFAMIILACLVAQFVFRCDYGACGILAIYSIYIWKEKPMLGFSCAVVVLGLLADPSEFLALLMLIPISLYNGERGPKVKYFFYVFYPAHLLLLSLTCYALGLGI